MSRVYFSSTSYNCTEAVAISHTLRNDNKVEEKNGWRPWRVNVFFSPCAFANFFLLKKKKNGKRCVSGFVEERRKIVTLFMMVECTF